MVAELDQYGIPEQFYRESWEDIEHPLACVDLDNRFRRVNHAFERMLGYSDAELRGRTWMEFTRQEHVGGDLQSVQDVIEGRADSYRLEKDYRHKRGHFIPIVLTVRRYPRASHEPLGLFRVEAPLATATRPELDEFARHFEEVISSLRERQEKIIQGVTVSVENQNNQIGRDNSGFDSVGRDKTSSSDRMLRYLMTGFGVMCVVMAWLMYYVATTALQNSQQTIEPPAIEQAGQP